VFFCNGAESRKPYACELLPGTPESLGVSS
jgi:hypothetical protein